MSESNQQPPLANSPTCAPYGSWQSAISADLLVCGSVRLSEPQLINGRSYWLESRPAEKGRSVLVEHGIGSGKRDLLPSPLSVRSKAHEYGGASYVVYGQTIYFVLAADQRIYRMDLDAQIPEPLTIDGAFRYADLCIDPQYRRLICVQEDESAGEEAVAKIVAFDLAGPAPAAAEVLIDGADFYSNPAMSPDGTELCYLQWHHPNMPWDATELHVAKLDNQGNITRTEKVAGENSESIFQPQWSPTGELFYVSDKNNWWNIYQLGMSEPIWRKDAEFATPQWVFGMSTYGFITQDEIFCTFTEHGRWQLAQLNIRNGSHKIIQQGNCDFEGIRCENGRALFISAGADQFPAVTSYTAATDSFTTLASSNAETLPDALLSHAQAVQFSVRTGTAMEEREVHAFYYPPTNPEFCAAANEKPPMIVFSHGGPTGATSAGLNLKIQYWTSRGFAILDVNYSGSTGYGRKYRDRLQNSWGIIDVEDVCTGAEYMVAQGLADPERLLIKGGSAGGYTVLAALTFHETFSAGASHYGIGDLTTLARDTHKFESRYLDKLVGPWPASEKVYRERSPINHIEQLNCPVIFFQGLEDKVVPPNQAEDMVNALKERGLPVAYITFADEGHGFRSGSSIKMSLEGELEFYSRIFSFPLPQPGPGIKIYNLQEQHNG